MDLILVYMFCAGFRQLRRQLVAVLSTDRLPQRRPIRVRRFLTWPWQGAPKYTCNIFTESPILSYSLIGHTVLFLYLPVSRPVCLLGIKYLSGRRINSLTAIQFIQWSDKYPVVAGPAIYPAAILYGLSRYVRAPRALGRLAELLFYFDWINSPQVICTAAG